VASAGPYASLHLVPDRQPHQHRPLSFLQARCPSCRPTNSVKALKAINVIIVIIIIIKHNSATAHPTGHHITAADYTAYTRTTKRKTNQMTSADKSFTKESGTRSKILK